MGILNRLSAAFLLLDSCTKEPLSGASILVDGRRERVVRKPGGQYIFVNLAPGEHCYEIALPGYLSQRKRLEGTPESFTVLLMQMETHHPKLAAIPHLLLRVSLNGSPAAHSLLILRQETPVSGLRVTAPAVRGSWTIQLSGSQRGFLYQPALMGAAPVLLTAAEGEPGGYRVSEPLKQAVKEGELLRPVWELRTDRDGAAAFPVSGCFWQRDEISFTAVLGKKELPWVHGLPRSGGEEWTLAF